MLRATKVTTCISPAVNGVLSLALRLHDRICAIPVSPSKQLLIFCWKIASMSCTSDWTSEEGWTNLLSLVYFFASMNKVTMLRHHWILGDSKCGFTFITQTWFVYEPTCKIGENIFDRFRENFFVMTFHWQWWLWQFNATICSVKYGFLSLCRLPCATSLPRIHRGKSSLQKRTYRCDAGRRQSGC